MTHNGRETVLIVEDDLGVATLQRKQLERAGYSVLVAATAAEARRHVAEGHVQIIVLDFRLQDGVTGLDLHAELKAAGYDLPAILVTGFSDEATAIQALRAGVRDFVTKSVEYLDYLPEAVGRVLNQARLRKALRESEERFQLVSRATNDAVWDWNITSDELWWSENFQTLFGTLAGPIEHGIRSWETRLHHQDSDRVISGLRRTLDGTDCNWTEEYRFLRTDGSYADVLHRGSVIRGREGRPTRMVGALMDITDRKRAEQSQRASEERFQAFMDNSPAAAFMKDPQGRMVYANATLIRRFELEGREWLGKTSAEIWPSETAAKLDANDRKVLSEGKSIEVVEEVPDPDGTLRSWHVYKFPIRDAAGHTYLGGMAADITDRRRAEQALQEKETQLRQAQKLDAIGQLAGGVAHEYNNLLQAILGYTSFAMEALNPADQAYLDLQEAEKAARRAGELTNHLLGFSRRQVLRRADIRLNDAVADLLKMLRPIIGADIEIRTELSGDTGVVHADAGLIQQMLLNLCVNARDAMPEGGRLTIKTRNVDCDAEYCESWPGMVPGPYVLITVADTGCGMTAEVRAKLFEPFFTTKGVGKGTGLGLALVYGIVQQHGGAIHVYSEPGLGTTFRIHLPLTVSVTADSQPVAVPVPRGGSETILFADDEPFVRNIAVRILRRAGYTVVTAADGEEAMRRFDQQPRDIAAALLDVVMPKAGGDVVYRYLRARRPDLPVVFCSGYDPDTRRTEFVLREGLPLLQKPFDAKALLQSLREALDTVDASRHVQPHDSSHNTPLTASHV